MAWELATKEEVATIHPTDMDKLEDFWSDTVEAMIREHLSAPNLGAPKEITEVRSGNGTPVLAVRKPPIQSVTKVTMNTATLDANDYVVFPNHIQLKTMNFPEGNLNVEITYFSGAPTSEVPYQVKLTAASMIAAIINYRNLHGSDSSIKWAGMDRQMMGEESPNRRVGLTSHLDRIMKRMLRRERVRVR